MYHKISPDMTHERSSDVCLMNRYIEINLVNESADPVCKTGLNDVHEPD